MAINRDKLMLKKGVLPSQGVVSIHHKSAPPARCNSDQLQTIKDMLPNEQEIRQSKSNKKKNKPAFSPLHNNTLCQETEATSSQLSHFSVQHIRDEIQASSLPVHFRSFADTSAYDCSSVISNVDADTMLTDKPAIDAVAYIDVSSVDNTDWVAVQGAVNINAYNSVNNMQQVGNTTVVNKVAIDAEPTLNETEYDTLIDISRGDNGTNADISCSKAVMHSAGGESKKKGVCADLDTVEDVSVSTTNINTCNSVVSKQQNGTAATLNCDAVKTEPSVDMAEYDTDIGISENASAKSEDINSVVYSAVGKSIKEESTYAVAVKDEPFDSKIEISECPLVKVEWCQESEDLAWQSSVLVKEEIDLTADDPVKEEGDTWDSLEEEGLTIDDMPAYVKQENRHFDDNESVVLSDIDKHLLSATSFSSSQNLILRAPAEKCFQCDICNRVFTKPSDFKAHLLAHAGEKTMPTNAKQEKQQQHLNNSESFGHYEIDKHLLPTSSALNSTPTAEKHFQCDFCSRSFTEAMDFRNHLFAHAGEKPHLCHLCDRCFARPGHLQLHLRAHSSGGVVSARKVRNREGLVRNASHKKPFRCEHCSKRFRNQSTLANHVRTRCRGKHLECSQCHLRFAKESRLRKHIRKQSCATMYPCTRCDKTFKRNSCLQKHLRFHKNPTPWSCNQCDKLFKYRSGLLLHIRIAHVGEKPFGCEHCELRFSQRSNLNVHVKKHHSNAVN